ncbi:hypothetical protein VTN02DRAFT_6684 [Thermoascus thermophilus]
MSQGKSLALSQNTFLKPPSEDQADRDDDRDASPGRQRRLATVYDAVAGRVASDGFLATAPYASRYRDTTSSSAAAVRPEEVLFRRLNAPIRYEENDFYFAHERLPPHCALPPADLLQAIHAYAADFYHHATVDRGQDDFRSMDETALIAMGILLEEMAQESLGETGDLVLVEGEEISISDSDGPSSGASTPRFRRKRTGSLPASSGDELRRPPKPTHLSPTAKQAQILAYIRSTRTCHTLRDLEKSVPSAVASVHGMQVKEHIQALTDEGQLRVEKIGSGNWYWCFGSEAKRERERVRGGVEREVERAARACEEVGAALGRARDEAARAREDDEDEDEREELLRRKAELAAEVSRLRADEEALRDEAGAGAGGLKRKMEEMAVCRRDAGLWTDNIYILEEYLGRLAGGDRELVDAVRRECYGEERVD